MPRTNVRFISYIRPVTFLLVLAFYLVTMPPDMPMTAFLAVSSAFFLASSAIIVRWIPATESWRSRLLWAEILLSVVLNFFGPRIVEGGPMPIILYPIAVTNPLQLDRSQWLAATVTIWLGWLGGLFPSNSSGPTWAYTERSWSSPVTPAI